MVRYRRTIGPSCGRALGNRPRRRPWPARPRPWCMRDRLKHDRAGGNACAVTDLDIAEYLGARSDQYATSNLGMAVARLLAGAAKRHLLQDRDVILDHSGLTHDEPGGMVKEDAAPDWHGRIDVGLEHR